MIENAFDKKFKEASRGNYPFLKFTDAEYCAGENSLRVNFLQSTRHGDVFDDVAKAAVKQIVRDLVGYDLDVTVKYTKCYADENAVKQKVKQFLVKECGLVFTTGMSGDDISAEITESGIKIVLSAPKEMKMILVQDGTAGRLEEELDREFVEPVSVELFERMPKEGDATFDGIADEVGYIDNSRLIKITLRDKVYGRGNITTAPIYICDAAESASTNLCGKITIIDKKMYNNKNYGRKDVKKGGRTNTSDEQLAMYKFTLSDTTGNISVVVFPNKPEDEALESLQTGDTLAVSGRIAVNSYSGGLQLTADIVSKALIDYDSITTEVPAKKEPKDYEFVKPVPYIEEKQSSIFDKGEQTPDYLAGKTFVIFDTETTGLNPVSDKIIEIGAVKMKDGRITEVFETLIDPMEPIPPDSIKTHHITDDMVKGSPVFSEVLPDFYKFTRNAVLVGHNVEFDYKMLAENSRNSGYVFDNELEDTIALAKKFRPMRNYKLQTLCEELGVVNEEAHRASADALATAKCFYEIAKYIK